MPDMGRRGIATVAAVVAVVAMAGVAVGTPIAVDSLPDQQPGDPLYGLERAGERIKEATFAGGQSWDLKRAMERTDEYEKVASGGIANNHVGLLEGAGQRILGAIKKAEDMSDLKKVREVIQEHERVLERVRSRVNENAKPAISLALSRSARARMVLKDVETGEIPHPESGGRPEIAERLQKVEQEMEGLEEEVRESIRGGRNPNEVAQRVEIKTAEEMTEKFAEMAEEGKAEEYMTLAEEAQNRLRNAARNAVDNAGLQRAIEAVQRHIRVLERVRGQVPDNAKPAIERALRNSRRAVSVLENMARGLGGRIPPGPLEGDQEDGEEEAGDVGRSGGSIPPGDSVGPLKFVHERGNLPSWVPGPPPLAGPGGGSEETSDEERAAEGDGYALLGDGVKLRDLPVSYYVNPSNDHGLNGNDVLQEVGEAFEAWDARTSTELFDDTVSPTSKGGFNQDGQNVVSFTPLSESGAVGETRVWYDESTGEVLEFDIVLNSAVEWGIDPDGEGPETISAYDVRNIAVHEAGHTLVLKDVQDEDYGHLTMYYRSEPGSSVKISLEEGDIVGLHELYGD